VKNGKAYAGEIPLSYEIKGATFDVFSSRGPDGKFAGATPRKSTKSKKELIAEYMSIRGTTTNLLTKEGYVRKRTSREDLIGEIERLRQLAEIEHFGTPAPLVQAPSAADDGYESGSM
jgi:hypothetical protein